jgi:hypothetical protein
MIRLLLVVLGLFLPRDFGENTSPRSMPPRQ